MDEQDAKVGASECEQDGYHTTEVTRLLKEKKVLSFTEERAMEGGCG